MGRWTGVLAVVAVSTALVFRHSNPWVGPLGPSGTVAFLFVVAACFLPYAVLRVRDLGRLTAGLLLVPAIAALAVVVAGSPTPAATRWSRSEAAFVAVDRTLPAGWPTGDSTVSNGLTAGLFDVDSVIRNDGDTYYVIQGDTDSDSCQGGIANMPHGPAGSSTSSARHLDGPWYAFTACWD